MRHSSLGGIQVALMKLIAHNKTLLIKPDKPKELTEGGIALPDVAKEKPRSGVVVIGPDHLINKRIYYPNYFGTEFEYLFEMYHIVKEDEFWFAEDS